MGEKENVNRGFVQGVVRDTVLPQERVFVVALGLFGATNGAEVTTAITAV